MMDVVAGDAQLRDRLQEAVDAFDMSRIDAGALRLPASGEVSIVGVDVIPEVVTSSKEVYRSPARIYFDVAIRSGGKMTGSQSAIVAFRREGEEIRVETVTPQ